MSEINDQLMALAQAFGLQREYEDTTGKIHAADLQTALTFLAEKGVHLGPQPAAPDPQTLIISLDAQPDRLSITFPGGRVDTEARELHIRAVDEEGDAHDFRSGARELTTEYDASTRALRVAAPFPGGIRQGAYRIDAEVSTTSERLASSARWIACPPTAFEPAELRSGRRIAGIGVALYGLRSRRNWGIGDFTDLKAFVEWARDDAGVDLVGINPLHALFNRVPYHTSPYLPSSRLYRNFIYLDVESVPDFQGSHAARALVNRSDVRRSIESLRDRERVTYQEVAALKRDVLREVFRSIPRDSARWDDFAAYRKAEGVYLEQYATFCALEEHFRATDLVCQSWRDWPSAYRDPSSREVAEFREHHEDAVLFHAYLQWQIEEQLAAVQRAARDKGMIVGLYHDLAVGVDRDGADSWSLQPFFHDGFSTGAPPDDFAPEGQDWGFAPPNREAMRRAGYEPFLKDLRANCKHGGALRIDHVMKVHRLFWIPKGSKARYGVYVRDYEADLLNVIALQSNRSGTAIIGEDLGTVPYDLRHRLMAKGIYSYRLFYFERDQQGNQLPCRVYPENALVSVSTHDLPSLAAFWPGKDIDLRLSLGQISAEREAAVRQDRTDHKARIIARLVQDGHLPAERAHQAWIETSPTKDLHEAVLDFLFRTPSKIALINQEDIFLDDRQQNLPGTTSEHPNWVTKMRYTIEELRSDPEARRYTERFYRRANLCGRIVR